MIIRFVALIGFLFCVNQLHAEQDKKPNIIYILADDMGYGDVGVYGQQVVKTPNIDKLASEGMQFMQHYAGNTVCSPSRCALMTGKHMGHAAVRGNIGVKGKGDAPLPPSEFTIAELLKNAGYTTGAFGKWGLGYIGSEGDANHQGFDEFFGYTTQRIAHNYYPFFLSHNGDTVMLEGNKGTDTKTYAPFLIHEKAMAFLEDNYSEPFFLYYATNIPHAEMVAPSTELAPFRGKLDPEFEYKAKSSVNYKLGRYETQLECHAAFAAMITILDRQVGEVMQRVKELGIEDNTLIIFSSDNGPHREGGGDPDYFDCNGPLRGYKRDLSEGGIRVPFIAAWNGVIEPGSKSEHVSAFWDMLPTFADIIKADVSGDLDGLSLWPELSGKGLQRTHDYLYWEFHEQGGKQAIRKENWKAIRLNVNSDIPDAIKLYDLSKDLGEQHDVATEHPKVVASMAKLFQKARTPHPDYPLPGE